MRSKVIEELTLFNINDESDLWTCEISKGAGTKGESHLLARTVSKTVGKLL